MIISLIVAIDRERGIGREGKLPWRLSADLRHFRNLTMGHHLIVGRKTWETIGRQLDGRKMVIVTRNPSFRPADCPECKVVNSVEAALELAYLAGEIEAFIGGGGQIFQSALALADRIYLTEVDTFAKSDVFFPPIDPHEWEERDRVSFPPDDKNEHGYSFITLERYKQP